jgi:hypothetical protein
MKIVMIKLPFAWSSQKWVIILRCKTQNTLYEKIIASWQTFQHVFRGLINMLNEYVYTTTKNQT